MKHLIRFFIVLICFVFFAVYSLAQGAGGNHVKNKVNNINGKINNFNSNSKDWNYMNGGQAGKDLEVIANDAINLIIDYYQPYSAKCPDCSQFLRIFRSSLNDNRLGDYQKKCDACINTIENSGNSNPKDLENSTLENYKIQEAAYKNLEGKLNDISAEKKQSLERINSMIANLHIVQDDFQLDLEEQKYVKSEIEGELFGEDGKDLLNSILVEDNKNSSDDIFGKDTNAGQISETVSSRSGVLFSDSAISVSWAYQFIETQNIPILGNPSAQFNKYKITGSLRNLTRKTLRFTMCCSEIRHKKINPFDPPSLFARFKIQLDPFELNEESYYLLVSSGESVPDPTISLAQYVLLGGKESDIIDNQNHSLVENLGQKTLYSDSLLTLTWEYRYLKTLACGVPLDPNAKFIQYQITVYLISSSSKPIHFNECCTEVRHTSGNSGCGSTGGFVRFGPDVSAKSTNRETYQILIPEKESVPDPTFTIAGYNLN